MRKLTKQKILQLPELCLSMTAQEIGDRWGVHKDTVHYHVEKLRSKGYKIKWKSREIIK